MPGLKNGRSGKRKRIEVAQLEEEKHEAQQPHHAPVKRGDGKTIQARRRRSARSLRRVYGSRFRLQDNRQALLQWRVLTVYCASVIMLHLAPRFGGNRFRSEIVTRSGRIPLLIVGGGIGGLATALAASQAGIHAHVIEKSQDFAEIGAGLQLAPNAMRALDHLGIYQDIREHAFFPKKLVLMDALTAEPVVTLNVGEKFQAHFGYPYIVVHRGDLLSTELEACRASALITLESNKEAVHIEDLGEGARVTCSDGSIYECDALIGADGLRSRVPALRARRDGDPICAQCMCYRGAIPIEQAPPESDLENMTVWVGPDIHFAQYVIHPRHRVQPSCRIREPSLPRRLRRLGLAQSEFAEHFSRVHPRLRTAAATIKFDRRWPMFDRRPIDNWTRNRITLLGDAAHPMFQYLAQGANQALEDAACLRDKLQDSGGDFSRAFLAYQKARIPRTARVQNAARFAGELFHVQGAGRVFRNLLLAKRTEDDVEHLEWIWGYRGCAAPAFPGDSGNTSLR